MFDFKGLGQPTGRQLESLPVWAREWIETLKHQVMYWHARGEGRHVSFAGRVNVREPDPAHIFGLPVWAQDWIDLLHAEAIDRQDKSKVAYWQRQQSTTA